MTLYFIGLGLYDERDITVRGLETVRKCEYIYLESYTSILHCSINDLEALYHKKIIFADREMVEKKADEILNRALTHNVALLVIGDIFGATTHTDIMLRAKEKNVTCEYIHNASIINAIGIVGLELYKYGKITSIPFSTESFMPETPYDVIKMNRMEGLHALVLLDLRPDEQRYMTINEAIKYLLHIEHNRRENIFTEDTLCIGCARVGSNDFKIKVGKAKDLLHEDFGRPLHCLIIPGAMHFIEEEALKQWE
ncbi:MAG: diphthine synthase [Candidatus Woesearchaeota archaeon]